MKITTKELRELFSGILTFAANELPGGIATIGTLRLLNGIRDQQSPDGPKEWEIRCHTLNVAGGRSPDAASPQEDPEARPLLQALLCLPMPSRAELASTLSTSLMGIATSPSYNQMVHLAETIQQKVSEAEKDGDEGTGLDALMEIALKSLVGGVACTALLDLLLIAHTRLVMEIPNSFVEENFKNAEDQNLDLAPGAEDVNGITREVARSITSSLREHCPQIERITSTTHIVEYGLKDIEQYAYQCVMATMKKWGIGQGKSSKLLPEVPLRCTYLMEILETKLRMGLGEDDSPKEDDNLVSAGLIKQALQMLEEITKDKESPECTKDPDTW